MSNFGHPPRKLWYTMNRPEVKENLRPEVQFKFLYGDILEELILPLIEESGHTVEARQEEVTINGLKGHIDAIIDGMLIDVKSANTRAFTKWKDGSFVKNDPFGYLDQLHLYLTALQDDDRLTHKNEAGWIVIDKELGHVILRTMRFPSRNYHAEIDNKRAMLTSSEPPERCYSDVIDRNGVNRKLDIQCMYCQFKQECWPSLRVFLYSNGPVYLTKVVKAPNVPELKS